MRERWIPPDSESGGIPHLFGTSVPPIQAVPDGLVMTTTTTDASSNMLIPYVCCIL